MMANSFQELLLAYNGATACVVMSGILSIMDHTHITDSTK